MRVYRTTVKQLLPTGSSDAFDVVTLFAPSSKPLKVFRWGSNCRDSSLAVAQMVDYQVMLLGPTLGGSTGGSTGTPGRMDPQDSASSATFHTGDTSKATSSGTTITLENRGHHLYNDLESDFDEQPVIVPAGWAFVIRLESSIQGVVNADTWVEHGEEG